MCDVPSYREKHIAYRAPGVEKIKTLCDECLHHGWTWYEFVYRVRQTMHHEGRVIRAMMRGTEPPVMHTLGCMWLMVGLVVFAIFAPCGVGGGGRGSAAQAKLREFESKLETYRMLAG